MFMNKTSIGSAVAAALLALCASSASAQTSGNITIGGEFIPPTCSVTISSNGLLDWGTMTRQTVNNYSTATGGTAKVLPTRNATLSVSCLSPTVIGMEWTDNRSSTRMTIDANDVFRFGLGNSNIAGQALGSYEVKFGTATSSTGTINQYYLQPTTGGAWSKVSPAPTGAANVGFAHPTYVSALGINATSTVAPAPLLDYVVPLAIQPLVSAAIVTASTSSIVMDGSATVTLRYF